VALLLVLTSAIFGQKVKANTVDSVANPGATVLSKSKCGSPV